MNLFFQISSMGVLGPPFRPFKIMVKKIETANFKRKTPQKRGPKLIKKRWVKKLIYHTDCPFCGKHFESEFLQQLKWNYNSHVQKCSGDKKVKLL